MNLRRIRFSEEVSKMLGRLKGRTGITPNILARIAFCMSVEEPGIPHPSEFPTDGDRVIDRPVLLGTYDGLYVALIRERCAQDGLAPDDDELAEHFRAHVHRGVHLLHKRVKKLGDMVHLVPPPVTDDEAAPADEAPADEQRPDLPRPSGDHARGPAGDGRDAAVLHDDVR
jgi:DNA sulfur modification protein DndE